MLLTENQLDTIIKDASESLGLDNEALKTLGVDAREKRQAMREPDTTPLSNNRWEMPIAFAFDANICKSTSEASALHVVTHFSRHHQNPIP